MSGFRVDHCPFGHASETTWHPTEEAAMTYAAQRQHAVAWFDSEMWPVDRGPYSMARVVRDGLLARVPWLRLEAAA